LGDVFVVRTAGNVADAVALGSIEYAVDHIHSPLLAVLGHQKCGAVNAARSCEEMPSQNLNAIVDKIKLGAAKARTYAKADDPVESAIKENVRNLHKIPFTEFRYPMCALSLLRPFLAHSLAILFASPPILVAIKVTSAHP
jgi:carbonic anhydrase